MMLSRSCSRDLRWRQRESVLRSLASDPSGFPPGRSSQRRTPLWPRQPGSEPFVELLVHHLERRHKVILSADPRFQLSRKLHAGGRAHVFDRYNIVKRIGPRTGRNAHRTWCYPRVRAYHGHICTLKLHLKALHLKAKLMQTKPKAP